MSGDGVRVLELTRQDARRLAVRAQVLTAQRPDGVMDAVERLTFLQHDPIAAVAPSADLVLFSRLGSAYDPRELEDLVAQQRIVEVQGRLMPAHDVRLLTAEMAAWPGPDAKPWAVVATAHPAKFDGIVAPLVGQSLEPPPALAAWLARPAQAGAMAAEYTALRQHLLG